MHEAITTVLDTVGLLAAAAGAGLLAAGLVLDAAVARASGAGGLVAGVVTLGGSALFTWLANRGTRAVGPSR